MDGIIANLSGICDLADKGGAFRKHLQNLQTRARNGRCKSIGKQIRSAQLSAGHTKEDIDFIVEAFKKTRVEIGR